MRSDVYTTVKR